MTNYLSTIGYETVSLEDAMMGIIRESTAVLGSSVLSIGTTINKDYFKISRSYNRAIDKHLEYGMFGNGFKSEFEMYVSKGSNYYTLYLPNRDVILFKNGGIYKSSNGAFIGIESGNTFTVTDNDFTYVFENGLLQKVKKQNEDIYVLTYEDGHIKTIQGIYDLVSFEYENNYVKHLYLNGILRETYLNYNGFLIGVRGDVNYNYSYLFNETGAKYGLLTQEEVNENIVNYSYDSLGRIISINRSSDSVEYEYLPGLLVKMTTCGRAILLYYDIYGNLVKEMHDSGLVRQSIEDENSITTFTNNLAQTAIYDDSSRLSTVIYMDGSRQTYEYSGNNITVTDENGNQYKYLYNENNELLKIIYPDNTYEEYTYLNGFLTSKKYRNGDTINYTYDSNGRVEKELYSDGSYVEYEYNEYYEISKISDETYNMKLSYDSLGLLTTVEYKDGSKLELEYDSMYRVISMKNPLSYVTKYEYNEFGYVSKVKNNSGSTITEYTYDSYGRVIKQKNSSSSYTEYTYSLGMLESIINYGKNKTVLSKFIYTYNSYGLIESVETLDGIFKYEYDSMGRVIKIESSSSIITYAYDSLGNRTSMTIDGEVTDYVVNELNQYVSIGNQTLSYNANGNLAMIIDGTTTWYFTYNAKNQLVMVSDGINTYSYTYDLFGNRDSVTYNGTTTNYYYFPEQNGALLASSKGSEKISYIYGVGLVGAYTNSKVYYYDYDSLGTVYEIVNSSGVVQNSYVYDANYSIISKQETITNPFTYIGGKGYLDDGSLLYRCGRRDILKGALVFTSPERHGINYGINLYQYAACNHINFYDSEGDEVTCAVCLGAVGIGIAYGLINQIVCDVASGSMSSVGSYVGAGLSGGVSGAGVVISLATGGLGTGASVALNMYGAGLGSFVGGVIDGFLGKDPIDWGGITKKALTEAGLNAIFGWIGDKTFPDALKNFMARKLPTIGKHLYELIKGFAMSELLEGLKALWKASGIPHMDPSGHICEGVDSNRIEGVKCTIYYSEVSSGAGAIIYVDETGQLNPLYSNERGEYGWDVPFGYWQVKFEKEGYFTQYTDWLPVPPIQLDVNVSLVSLASPTVVDCNLKKNEITFSFSQYMKVSEINSSKVKVTSNGKVLNGTFTALDAEESFADSTVMLAKTFKFIPTEEFNSLVTIEIENVINYTDTPLETKYEKSYDFKTNTPVNPDPDPDSPDPVNPEGEKGKDVNSSGLPAGAVVGISIGAVVVVAAIAAIVVFIVIKKKKSSARE